MSDTTPAEDIDRLLAAAATRDDELVALSTVLERDPHREEACLAMVDALKRQLQDDPFLAYAGEDDAVYRVRTASGLRVVVPKRRTVPRPYPPSEPGPLRPARRWLLLALLGLLPSGLGTVLFAPVALFFALQVPTSALSRADRKRRRVLMTTALLVWLLGLLLALVVLVHL